MSIWTWVAIAIVGFILVSTLWNKAKGSFSLPSFSLSSPNQTDNKTSPYPKPIAKAIDYLERKYELPVWILVLGALILYLILKR